MEEYPDFHGDTPISSHSKKEEKKCKCGGNCKCKKQIETEVKVESCGTNCGCKKTN